MTGQKERKTGRPKLADGERRDDRLPNIRVTSAERAAVEAKAAQAGLPLVEFCRRAILSRRVTPRQSATDERALVELNRAGVNLNQIARAVNGGRELPADFPEVLAEVRAAVAKVAGDGS